MYRLRGWLVLVGIARQQYETIPVTRTVINHRAIPTKPTKAD
jgi:hypothetical protein